MELLLGSLLRSSGTVCNNASAVVTLVVWMLDKAVTGEASGEIGSRSSGNSASDRDGVGDELNTSTDKGGFVLGDVT